MANTASDTKVLIGEVRFSYCHVFEPDSIDGGEGKYSISLIIPKKDVALVAKIKGAIETAYKAGIGKFGGKLPQVWKNPLRDGDLERPDDDAYAGAYFINASSKTKPGVVKAPKPYTTIVDEQELYSGCFGYASVNFFAFNTNGNKGIAAGLNNILKTRDGDYLGGRQSAQSDFDELEFQEDMPDFSGDDVE